MVLYAAAKFIAYALWCYVALRLGQPAGATVMHAAGLGAFRWVLGLGFGIAVFILVGSIDVSDAMRMYILVYTPIRAIEWGIMAALIDTRVDRNRVTMPLWCLGGIVVSCLADLLSPDGLQGRFCIGRCLC